MIYIHNYSSLKEQNAMITKCSMCGYDESDEYYENLEPLDWSKLTPAQLIIAEGMKTEILFGVGEYNQKPRVTGGIQNFMSTD